VPDEEISRMKAPKTRSPLKASPLRFPGQSVEEEREKLLSDVVEQWFYQAFFFVLFAALEWYRYYMDMKPSPWLFSGFAMLMATFGAWRIGRVLPQLRNLRLARDGERVVGQFLERLRERGYQVFHDLVGEGFNVDHVLIGPGGVFTVETKTWSKPLRGAAEIRFDGDRITVGDREPDRDPVAQAKAQANWIRELLQESTGKRTVVRSVVVFPGWYISRTNGAHKDVWVLEPKALPAFLEKEPARLNETDIRLFAYHVSRLNRVKEAGRAS
jgi:hypothetical protein